MFAILLGQSDCVKVILEIDDQNKGDQKSGQNAYDEASKEIQKRFSELDEKYSSKFNSLPFRLLVNPIYATPEKHEKTKVHIDCDKTQKRKGGESLLFGSFMDLGGRSSDVVVKIKTEERNLHSEARLYTLFESSPQPQFFLHCYNQVDPRYLVLEDAGQDLTYMYTASEQIRITLIPQILEAVYYLHQLKIMHGDLKPENILVKERNYQFTCKLCDFDSAVEVGHPFVRTSRGDLKFSFEWVCPEIFLAFDKERSTNNRVEILATLEMDIFNLGLIVDLLCRPQLVANMTILPSIVGDSDTHTNLKQVLTNEKKLYLLIHCIQTNRSYGSLIRDMLSFEPLHRHSLDYYQQELREFSRTGFFRRFQSQKNFALERDQQHYNNFLDQLKKVLGSSDLSTAEQLRCLETNLGKIIENVHLDIKELDSKIVNKLLTSITGIQNTLDQLKSDFPSQAKMDEGLKEVQSRMAIMEENVSQEITITGNVQAKLMTSMSLHLVNISKRLHRDNLTTHAKLQSLEEQLCNHRNHLTEVAAGLRINIVTTGEDLQKKIEIFESLAKEGSSGFSAAAASVTCKEELSFLCSELKSDLESKVLKWFQEIKNETQGQENANLVYIRGQLENLKTIAESNENLKDGQSQLLEAIKSIDQHIDDEFSHMNDIVADLRAEIFDSLNEILEVQSKNSNPNHEIIERMMEDLVKKFQPVVPESELRQLILSTYDSVNAVRNFQNISAYDAHNYPLLFIVSNERIKEGKLNGIYRVATKYFRKSYRIHFLCEVCGSLAPSGKKSRFGAFVPYEDQTGYRLSITHEWVHQLAYGMKCVLKVLEIAGKLAGLPIPAVANLIDDIQTPIEIISAVKEVTGEVKDIYQAIVPQDDGQETKDDLNSQNEHLNREERQKINDDRLAACHELDHQKRKEYWEQNEQKITLDHVKLVKKLLEALGDPTGGKTGLQRCLRSVDNTCAWVCQNKTCSETFLEKGKTCCVIQTSFA